MEYETQYIFDRARFFRITNVYHSRKNKRSANIEKCTTHKLELCTPMCINTTTWNTDDVEVKNYALKFFIKWRGMIRFLTLILLTWRIWRASNIASRWQMEFNSALKGLNFRDITL
jgi:hypothetical protein